MVVAFAIMLISIVHTKFSPFILLYVSARESQCESPAIVVQSAQKVHMEIIAKNNSYASILADISSVNCTHITEDV